MEYKITYKITSEFIAYVYADSKMKALETFREFDIGHEIAEEHGDIEHDEVEVVSVRHNTYKVDIYCHRLGCEVEVYASSEEEAIKQHLGECGNKHDPCDAEAMEGGE